MMDWMGKNEEQNRSANSKQGKLVAHEPNLIYTIFSTLPSKAKIDLVS